MLSALLIFAIVYLSVQLVLLISNLIAFPILPEQTKLEPLEQASVSILIPARNEALNLPETLPRILAQAEATEIIVLDDNSEDATANIIQELAQQDTRLRYISGKNLPEGWGGKNWACQQLAEVAQGDILIFTDADVRWQEGALASILAFRKKPYHETDVPREFISLIPRQLTDTLLERITVPVIDLSLLSLLSYVSVRFVPLPIFVTGNGQLMLWTRAAYQKIGGHAAFKAEVMEDVIMAQAAKKAGIPLAVALGAKMMDVKMYHNWQEMLEGFSKNLLAIHGNMSIIMLLNGLAYLIMYTLPWVLCWWQPLWFIPALMGVLQRALVAWKTKRSIWEAFLQPLMPFVLLRIGYRAFMQKGYRWKGRQYDA